jgi:hypothetical protein
VDNVVAAWTYAAAQQILDETQSTFLAQAAPIEPHFSTMLKEKSSPYPSRGSSLSKNDQPIDDAQALFESLKGRAASADNRVQQRSSRDYLAGERAKLLLIQRQVVQEIARRQQFVVGWAGTHGEEHRKPGDNMADVNLSDDDKSESDQSSPERVPSNSDTTSRAGLYYHIVLQAASSEEDVRTIYEVRVKYKLERL